MADDNIVPDPGTWATTDYSGALPVESESSMDVGSTIPNLTNTFSPVLSLPATTMSTSASGTYSGYTSASAYTGLPAGSAGTTTSSGTNALDTSLLNFGEGAANSLVGAFVVNPQNAATQEGLANTSATNALTASSQLFSYLLLGLAIFLIFSFAEKKG
jgi:hypothetical protein